MTPGAKAAVLAAYRLNLAQLANNAAWYSLAGAPSDSTYLTTTASFTGTGTATSTLISTAFVGVGTAFLAELGAGDTVYTNADVLIGTIQSITDNNNAVLTGNGAAAITGAAFKIVKAGARVQLIADRSGNSAVNGLVLNGVSGNYASAPSTAALNITGDIVLDCYLAPFDWTNATEDYLVTKYAGLQASYALYRQSGSTGKLQFLYNDGSDHIKTSTVATSFVDGTAHWVRVTFDVDNGAGGNDVKFWTSDDGVTWTQLGATVTTAGTVTIATSTALVNIGGINAGTLNPFVGTIYRARIYNGIAGTLVFDANFTTVAKLATSFTESSANAATVTINTTGDLGARICGARDRVQLTPSKQRLLRVVGGYNQSYRNSSSQYEKSAPFPLVQPAEIYFVGSQETWSSGNYFFDGAAANSGAVIQTTTTPQLNLNAGSSVAANTGLAVGTKGLIYALFSGAASLLGINLQAETTGNAGAASMNGVTGGASGTPGSYGDTTESEMLIRNVASDATLRAKIKAALIRKWGISA